MVLAMLIAIPRYLLAEKYFEKIDIFEQRGRVGGVWIHASTEDKSTVKIPVPQPDPNQPPEEPIWQSKADGSREATFVSPLYSNMETNIPKTLMEYGTKPFAEDIQLFPTFQQVLEYLEEYAEEVKHLIKFEHQVLDVKLDDPLRSNWAVTVKDLHSGKASTAIYDAVVAANGHYNFPYIPEIKGIEAWNQSYPGALIHSKVYDSADDFKDKKVIVVGNSASGVDIGSQISRVCNQPLISSHRSVSEFVPVGGSSDRVPRGEIVEFLSPALSHRGVRFTDGTTEEDIDAIVFCTGYFYAYPFLSSLKTPVFTDGARALNVYQQLFYSEHPTLVLTVLPQKVVPFPVVENQAAVFSRVWSQRLKLPSKAEMQDWESGEINKRGSGKGFHIIPFPLDADYNNMLHDWAATANSRPGLENDGTGKLGIRWGDRQRWIRSRFPDIKKSFVSQGEGRRSIRRIEDLGFQLPLDASSHESSKL
jgi:cation diffusion facilitator CzcD-associated flavoprotein CzcO